MSEQRVSQLSVAIAVPGAPVGAPTSMDARCARLALVWSGDAPLCCARGAAIDARAKMEMAGSVRLEWAKETPVLVDAAPSGVIARLADVPWAATIGCAALDAAIAGTAGGVDGSGCKIRVAAHKSGRAQDAWLLDGCAIFPLDVVDGELVPSSRIAGESLVTLAAEGRRDPSESRDPLSSLDDVHAQHARETTPNDRSHAMRSLWDEARPRVAARWGEAFARAVDAVAGPLRAHHASGVHLKTMK